jgi:hypothetical protein
MMMDLETLNAGMKLGVSSNECKKKKDKPGSTS